MHRTTDLTYGQDYWDTLDGGQGYQDSLMWHDIGHILHEIAAVDRKEGRLRRDLAALDLGCAHGWLVKNLRDRGIEAFGVDISEYALEHAAPEARDYLRRFDMTGRGDTHFGRERFDLAVSFETLEHIPVQHVRQAVQHVWNCLRPGGLAVMTICTVGQPDTRSDPTHVTVVPREWWVRLFDGMGFVPEFTIMAKLRWFWLFSEHAGVFAMRRPA